MNCIMSSKIFLNPSAENKTTNRIQRVSGMWLRLIVRDEERSGPLSSAPEQKMSSFYFDSACPRRLRGFGYSFIYFIWFTSGSEQNSLFLDPPNEKQ